MSRVRLAYSSEDHTDAAKRRRGSCRNEQGGAGCPNPAPRNLCRKAAVGRGTKKTSDSGHYRKADKNQHRERRGQLLPRLPTICQAILARAPFDFIASTRRSARVPTGCGVSREDPNRGSELPVQEG